MKPETLRDAGGRCSGGWGVRPSGAFDAVLSIVSREWRRKLSPLPTRLPTSFGVAGPEIVMRPRGLISPRLLATNCERFVR